VSRRLNPELDMIRAFLADCLPFSLLDDNTLARLAARMRVVYLKKGSLLRPGEDPGVVRVLRNGAVDIKAGDGRLLDRLGEGQSFDLGRIAGDDEAVTATTVDDCLVYCLPRAEIDALQVDDKRFRHLLDRHAAREPLPRPELSPDAATQLQPLRELLARDPVCLSATASITEAARLMTAQRGSSLLILEDGAGGIPGPLHRGGRGHEPRPGDTAGGCDRAGCHGGDE